MTTDEINIAIAEACGHDLHWKKALNYVASLDACAELCNLLAKEGWNCRIQNGLDCTWECEFYSPVKEGTPPQFRGVIYGEWCEIHYGCADAMSKAVCESFLRVKGLWRDGK